MPKKYYWKHENIIEHITIYGPSNVICFLNFIFCEPQMTLVAHIYIVIYKNSCLYMVAVNFAAENRNMFSVILTYFWTSSINMKVTLEYTQQNAVEYVNIFLFTSPAKRWNQRKLSNGQICSQQIVYMNIGIHNVINRPTLLSYLSVS